MDRTSELVTDYEKMQKIYEKFQERQALKVEGEWYLGEREGYPSFVCSSSWLTVEIGGHTVNDLREMGWTVTPVIIFRKSE